MKAYDHKKIEKKWQTVWDKKKAYKTLNNSKKKKHYVLDMFPYPSGVGLHVGHPKGYIGSDIYARLKRMQGFNVLHPMGYDAFGLPAEQYAIEHNINPRQAVEKNVKTFEKQLSIIGLSYDWDRRVNTTDPEFYKWTQWIFLKIYNSWYNTDTNKAEPIEKLEKIFAKSGNKDVHAVSSQNTEIFSSAEWKIKNPKEKQDVLMKYRLAYEGYAQVNWCPKLGTVLANDEVVDGKDGPVSERGGYPVEKKEMRQWFMRITAYADRLLSGLEGLDWSTHIKEIQKNWIGKSEGLIFSAKVKDTDLTIQTFSAHFEACYADTFFVIAPDHPFLPKLLEGSKQKDEVLRKAKEITAKRDAAKEGEYKEVEGIFTGRYAVDPLGNGDLPIWVASFALKDYGTGIVKCSAHDERDFVFANKYGIKLKEVIVPKNGEQRNFENPILDGVLTEPKEFAGREIKDVREEIADYVVRKGYAVRKVSYKMRDAIFARQRYWGEPIPLSYDKAGMIHELPEKSLPLRLPPVKTYQPTGTGESPLASVSAWTKKGYETNTMPGWAGSSWYFLRYMDPKNKKAFADKSAIKYWKNVDMYVGGAEHATGHLLYARFWHKFLKDYGLVVTEEPFQTLRNLGMILGTDNRKMSKRWGNVVNPDEVIRIHGADTLRVYEMFMGPFAASLPWSTDNIVGSRRFVERVWKLGQKILEQKIRKTSAISVEKILHKAIKKVGEDIETFSFNTSISTMMILLNEMEKQEEIAQKDFEIFLKILAPFAPHITEELWSLMGNKSLLVNESWPKFDPKKIVDQEMKIMIQVNGKVRADILVSADDGEDIIKESALANENVIKYLGGSVPKKIIYVKNRLINIVI
ncbi:MAG: leucine--tRNA ligase [Candidatus Pacebacteria bacterium]|nr:leucine--tRNA ligase [Candidatus Paceibacterota bacterium]